MYTLLAESWAICGFKKGKNGSDSLEISENRISDQRHDALESPGNRYIRVDVHLVYAKAELASGLRDARSESCHVTLHRENRARDTRIRTSRWMVGDVMDGRDNVATHDETHLALDRGIRLFGEVRECLPVRERLACKGEAGRRQQRNPLELEVE